MEKLVSSWFNTIQSLPQNYVVPTDKRPGKEIVPICNAIPVIDLRNAGPDRNNTIVQKILNASQEFGIFQVINHGVSENLMYDTMRVFMEFFDMSAEDKASFYSEDRSKSVRLLTSSPMNNYAKEEVHFWRDNLRHPCHPLGDFIHLWPEKPTRYRDVVGRYSVELRNLSLRILEVICEGLGLQPGYFGHGLSEVQMLSVNHYPPCPDPSLALGIPKHCDPNLITILLQGDVNGLQIFKDGQWFGVEPIPNAFVVNIGHQLQIISNGKLKSAEHRAVTNSRDPRTTIVTLINPGHNCIIEPAKALVSECNPPLYRAFRYKEFHNTYIGNEGDPEIVLEAYKIQA